MNKSQISIQKSNHLWTAGLKNLYLYGCLVLLMSVIAIGWSACGKACDGFTCQNGGKLLDNCTCNCEPGWEGGDCSIQRAPSDIKVTKVTLKGYSPDNLGQPWDTDDVYADPWVRITNGSGATLVRTNHRFDARFDQTYDLNMTQSSIFTLFSDKYTLTLWDCDDLANCSNSSSEKMETILFDIYSGTNGFPKVLTLESPSGKTVVELELAYSW